MSFLATFFLCFRAKGEREAFLLSHGGCWNVLGVWKNCAVHSPNMNRSLRKEIEKKLQLLCAFAPEAQFLSTSDVVVWPRERKSLMLLLYVQGWLTKWRKNGWFLDVRGWWSTYKKANILTDYEISLSFFSILWDIQDSFRKFHNTLINCFSGQFYLFFLQQII